MSLSWGNSVWRKVIRKSYNKNKQSRKKGDGWCWMWANDFDTSSRFPFPLCPHIFLFRHVPAFSLHPTPSGFPYTLYAPTLSLHAIRHAPTFFLHAMLSLHTYHF